MTTKPLIIAHRGASGLVKFENTLASFAKAIELGVSMVEFDIRKTQDNLFVAFHDQSIAMNRAASYWPIIRLVFLFLTGFAQVNHIIQFMKSRRI